MIFEKEVICLILPSKLIANHLNHVSSLTDALPHIIYPVGATSEVGVFLLERYPGCPSSVITTLNKFTFLLRRVAVEKLLVFISAGGGERQEEENEGQLVDPAL